MDPRSCQTRNYSGGEVGNYSGVSALQLGDYSGADTRAIPWTTPSCRTARAADHHRPCLHQLVQLAVDHGGCQQPEAVHPMSATALSLASNSTSGSLDS